MALVDGYRIKPEVNGELFDYHGSIRKNEFYKDNEFFNLPDTVHDPIFCDNPWPAHSDFGQRSRGELQVNSGRLTLDAHDPVGASRADQLSIALIRDDVVPGLIAPG